MSLPLKQRPKCPRHPGRIVDLHPCQATVRLPDGSRGICGYFDDRKSDINRDRKSNSEAQVESGTKALYLVPSDKGETRMNSGQTANPLPGPSVGQGPVKPAQLTGNTGELGDRFSVKPGQLMFGIDVPSIRIQRKADLGMTLDDFNATDWDISDGDRMTVAGKDGLLIVKLSEREGE